MGRRIAFWCSGHFPYRVLRSADTTDMTEVSRYATCQARYDSVLSIPRLTFSGVIATSFSRDEVSEAFSSPASVGGRHLSAHRSNTTARRLRLT